MSWEKLSLHTQSNVLTQCRTIQFVLRFISKNSFSKPWQNAIKFQYVMEFILFIYFFYMKIFQWIKRAVLTCLMNVLYLFNVSETRIIYVLSSNNLAKPHHDLLIIFWWFIGDSKAKIYNIFHQVYTCQNDSVLRYVCRKHVAYNAYRIGTRFAWD